MKILAEHPSKGQMTFDKKLFRQIKEQDSFWKIVNHDYEGTFIQVVKIKKIVKKPDILNIPNPITGSDVIDINKFDSNIYTVNEFRENLEKFTISELQILAKCDRKTIAKEAKNKLSKLSKLSK